MCGYALDVDICKQIAKDLGFAAEIRPVAVDARIAALQTGRVDVVLGKGSR
ncbi:transporter substrate-binding domain-containing protein [Paraburkholderia piptadeniae]|uniref:transporter substrate-binding domain-containing protein n=1 Tax=Paraburkholderia piptadeniae TaxID=1701573 RepID=UPI000B3FA234